VSERDERCRRTRFATNGDNAQNGRTIRRIETGAISLCFVLFLLCCFIIVVSAFELLWFVVLCLLCVLRYLCCIIAFELNEKVVFVLVVLRYLLNCVVFL
jgi:hypothetical protein